MSYGFKPEDMEKLIRTYSSAPVIKAHKVALRDTAKTARTSISRQVRTKYNVSAEKVKSKTHLVMDNFQSGRATLTFRDYRPNLGRFDKGLKSGLGGGRQVQVRKGGKPSVVKGSFKIKRISSELIWLRLTKAEKRSPKYAGRKSGLKVLRTIAIPEMARDVVNEKALNNEIQDQYAKRFNHHFARAIGFKR